MTGFCHSPAGPGRTRPHPRCVDGLFPAHVYSARAVSGGRIAFRVGVRPRVAVFLPIPVLSSPDRAVVR